MSSTPQRLQRLAVSPDEAAEMLSVSRSTFDREIRYEVRVVRLGRRIVIPVAELQRYLAENAARVLDDPRIGGA